MSRRSKVGPWFFGWPGRLIGALLLVAACTQAWYRGTQSLSYDHYQRWVIGTAVRDADTRDPYAPAERTRLDRLYDEKAAQYVGPDRTLWPKSRRMHAAHVTKEVLGLGTPLLYALTGWTASADYDRDIRVWQAISVLALAVSVLVLGRILGYPWAVLLLVGAALTSAFLPPWSDLRVGNVGRVQLGVVVAILALLQPPVRAWKRLLAGFAFGLLVVTKPNVVYIVPVLGLGWLMTQQLRKAVAFAAGAVVGAGLGFASASWFFGGVGVWRAWLDRIGEYFRGAGPSVEAGNASLSRVVTELLGRDAGAVEPMSRAVLIGGMVVAIAALVFGVARGDARRWSSPRYAFDTLLVGVGCCVSLVVAPLSWMHYYVLVLPLVAWVLRPGRPACCTTARIATSCAVVGVLGLLAIEPVYRLARPELVTMTWMVCGSGVLAFAAGLLELLALRPTPPVSEP